MDDAEALDACAVDAFEGTYPQFEVGVDGVLDQDRYVDAPERVGQFLHGKGIGCRTCSDPQDIDAVFHGQFDMLRCGHFRSDEHARLLFHTLHPRQCFFAVSFKTAWFGARFPYTSPEDFDAIVGKSLGGAHDLFFSLCAARTGNDHRTDGLDAWQIEGL